MEFKPGQKVEFVTFGQITMELNLPLPGEIVEIKGICPIEQKDYYCLVGFELDHNGNPQSFDKHALISINQK